MRGYVCGAFEQVDITGEFGGANLPGKYAKCPLPGGDMQTKVTTITVVLIGSIDA